MALKHVQAHFMHEAEEAAGQQILTKVEENTASYLLGYTDAAGIAKLKKAGLFVRVLDRKRPSGPRGGGAQPLIQGGRPHARGGFHAGPHLLQIKGPLSPERMKTLAAMGMTPGVRVWDDDGESGYLIEVDRSQQLSDLRALPFVDDVTPHWQGRVAPQPEVRGGRPPGRGRPPRNRRSPGGAPPHLRRGAPPAAFEIALRDGADDKDVERWIAEKKGKILKRGTSKLRALLPPDAVSDRDLPDWAEAVEPFAPRLWNDAARRLIGEPAMPAAVGALLGDGELVAVADTGFDQDHPDFANRIAQVVALGRKNDPSDIHGHGTHVSGTILGDGKASSGLLRGLAPRAKLFFQSLLDDEGGLGGLPVDLRELFQPAYDAGARVHNNSWGTAVTSRYTLNSKEVDQFVAEHRDMVIVISAGNEGSAAAPKNTKKGQVDWLSLGSPATAKNAITVGASRSDRKTGGYAKRTYGDVWGDEFPRPRIADESVSGDPECLAAFSSRGPCRGDRRIKPDLVAPGTDILSTRSSQAPRSTFWALHAPFNNKYAYMGGTSMSAPVVAGAAVLTRQYYRKVLCHQPSAALVKATLINGTRHLGGWDANADHDGVPNVHQGFGGLDLGRALPGNFQLEFSDDWGNKAKRLLQQSGDRFRFKVGVAAGTPLRICLAYTDAPSIGLQNDVDLFVEGELAGGKKIKLRGNQDAQGALGDGDDLNNVEVVRIDKPRAGTYRIVVSASNLLVGPQDFALVVTGALTSKLEVT